MTSEKLLRSSRVPALLALFTLLHGCMGDPPATGPDEETIAKLTITARPATPSIQPTVGYSNLGLASPRDGFMYVPTTYNAATPAPLLVLLHGAGGDADYWRRQAVEALAEQRGMIILATESRYDTWDGPMLGRYDADVAFLNSALLHVFARVNIDVTRTFIGGWSDGASEALGIGIANAGLFSRIIAFSPGGLNAPFSRGEPDVFVSHGTADEVAPFSNTRDIVVPRLRNNGMEVFFYVFDAGHVVPAYVEAAAFNWLFDN